MIDIASQQPGDRRRGEESDGWAAVVAACEAGLAGEAGDVGLDCDAVAGLEGSDGRVHGEDLPGGLVAEDVGARDDHGADCAGVPEVDVGAGGV